MRRAVIYLDGSPNDKDSLSFALAFCERLNARLSVVLILKPEEIYPAAIYSSVTVIHNSSAREAHAALGRQAYREMCAGKSFVDYAEATMGIADAIEAGDYLYDVTILERLTSTEGAEVVSFNAALFNSGAPVLITPPGTVASTAERVALVWNGTVPSARAIRSSLPILKYAKSVTVFTNADNARAKPEHVQRYLSCHEIAAAVKSFKAGHLTARGRGRAVLEAVTEAGSDFMVMGAFGGSRIEALLGLGRATEKVVTASKIPLLVQA
jgi:nucleotide-binding universal stress UspA family protein